PFDRRPYAWPGLRRRWRPEHRYPGRSPRGRSQLAARAARRGLLPDAAPIPAAACSSGRDIRLPAGAARGVSADAVRLLPDTSGAMPPALMDRERRRAHGRQATQNRTTRALETQGVLGAGHADAGAGRGGRVVARHAYDHFRHPGGGLLWPGVAALGGLSVAAPAFRPAVGGVAGTRRYFVT